MTELTVPLLITTLNDLMLVNNSTTNSIEKLREQGQQ